MLQPMSYFIAAALEDNIDYTDIIEKDGFDGIL